jgi:hypothetical protein
MNASEGRRPLSISPLSLVLGAGSSAVVATATLAGHDMTSPEVVAAFTVAGVTAVANVRHREYEAQPHVLRPLRTDGPEARILAPRARSMAAHPSAGHSDAA